MDIKVAGFPVTLLCCLEQSEQEKNIMKFVNRIIVAILSRTFYNKNDS